MFGIAMLLACILRASGQAAGSSDAPDASGLRTDGQPRAAVPIHGVALPAVDAVIQQAISEGQIPGAVLIVGHDGQVVYRKAYGLRALEPQARNLPVLQMRARQEPELMAPALRRAVRPLRDRR